MIRLGTRVRVGLFAQSVVDVVVQVDGGTKERFTRAQIESIAQPCSIVLSAYGTGQRAVNANVKGSQLFLFFGVGIRGGVQRCTMNDIPQVKG